MRPLLTLLRKDFLHLFRNKAALALTFAVPMVLIYIFGNVFGFNRKDTGPVNIRLAIVNLSPEPAAAALVDALKAEKTFRVLTSKSAPDGSARPLTEADVRAGLANNDYRFALVLPADLIPTDDFGIRMKFLTNPRNDVETMTVTGMLQKTIFAHVPQLLGQSLQANAKRHLGAERFESFNRTIATTVTSTFGGDPEALYQDLIAGKFVPSSTSGKKSDAPGLFSRIVNIQTEQVAGKRVQNPMASRMIGGYGIMFLLFAITASATSFFEEKNLGLFHRLLSSPISRAHLLMSKFLYGLSIGVLQLLVLFIFGDCLYHIDLWPHMPALFPVIVAAAAACASFGMLIASIASSPAAANGLSTLLVLTMSAVGGAWFPTSFLPEALQTVARFTIVYWSVEGFTDVLFAGFGFVQMLPKIGILLGITAIVLSFSVWRFNKGSLFD